MAPPIILTGLVILFFADLVANPTAILCSDYSDFVALHIPARKFLVQSFQETGELPYWCPYTFSGSPFVHDMQVAMFYPPHLGLCFLPAAIVGPAMSWLLVLHVWLAGMAMYGYARWQKLNRLPAFVAAFGYMFAGKWMLHLLAGGHYLIIGLAWLPLVLWCLERAITKGSFLSATGAGVFFALITLSTQPQWTFYAGIFVGLWTLATVIFSNGKDISPSTLYFRWLSYGIWTALLAFGIAAVQILPTMEATQLSVRAAGIATDKVQSEGLLSLLLLVGPALTNQLEPIALIWEIRGGFTILWLIMAALAPILAGGKIRFYAVVTALLFAFAFGGAILFQALPGFGLFRQPSRILIIAAFPVAILASYSVQNLFQSANLVPDRKQKILSVVRLVILACITLVVGLAIRLKIYESKPLVFHFYWVSLLLTIPGFFWLLNSKCFLSLPSRQMVLTVLLCLDLGALTFPLVNVQSEPDLYPRSESIVFLQERSEPNSRVLDRDYVTLNKKKKIKSFASPMGSGNPLARIEKIQTLRGFNPLDIKRYKEYLQFIKGDDKKLRAFDDTEFTAPVMSNFPINNRSLLDLLGVHYLLQPASWKPVDKGWQEVFLDRNPRTYDLDHGVISLPAYKVWKNMQAFPRVFVVPQGIPLPQRKNVLARLQETDFRKVVLLEDPKDYSTSFPQGKNSAYRKASFIRYQPNEVVVEVESGPPGYLVLTDIWYPGWKATIDGEEVGIYRANYLFRAVWVEGDRQQIRFTFFPNSLRIGMYISGISLGIIILSFLVSFVPASISKPRPRTG